MTLLFMSNSPISLKQTGVRKTLANLTFFVSMSGNGIATTLASLNQFPWRCDYCRVEASIWLLGKCQSDSAVDRAEPPSLPPSKYS